MKAVLLAVMLVVGSAAIAQNRCKTEKGATVFQDKPCATGQGVRVEPKAGDVLKAAPIGSEKHLQGVVDSLERNLVAERAAKVSREARTSRRRPEPEEPASMVDPSRTQPMPFDACVLAANRAALQVVLGGMRSVVVVDSSDLFMRRVCTNDGSVIVTCSRAENTMTTTASRYGSRAEGCF